LEQSGRGFYISIVGEGALVFVAVVLHFGVLLNPTGAVNNAPLAITLLVGLVVFGVALALNRLPSLTSTRARMVDARATIKIGICAGAALIIVALTTLYPFSGAAFGYTYYGFPLTSTVVACGEGPVTRCGVASNFFPFIVDYAFWLALVYPAISLADSARLGRLRDASRLTSVGVSALLSVGTLVVIIAFAALDIPSVNATLGYFGPSLYLGITFLPNAVLGAILVRAGAKELGLTTDLAGLVFLAILALAIFAH
jgi:hypothetical protein